MVRMQVNNPLSVKAILLSALISILMAADKDAIMNAGLQAHQAKNVPASSSNERSTKQDQFDDDKKELTSRLIRQSLSEQSEADATKVRPATANDLLTITPNQPQETSMAKAADDLVPNGILAMPNLTSYQPTGWSDKIVVSTDVGTHSDNSPVSTSDTLYLDWAVLNNGGAATAVRFYTKLFVDGVEKNTWFTDPPLNSNFFVFVEDYPLGSFGAGTHTLRIVTDVVNNISESNESDNEYTKTITVSAPSLPNLIPFQPTGWSDKIVVSTATGSHSDSSSLRTTDTLYLDWTVLNGGGAATTVRFYTKLFVDGVEKNTWFTDPALSVSFFTFVEDYSLGSLSAGTHTLRIVADALNNISESNESDNEYIKTITVSASSLPNLTPFQPTGWSDKIVVSTATGAHSDSSPLRSNDTLFVDWAVLNNGSAGTTMRFAIKLFVDGAEKASWFSDPPLNNNFFAFVEDFSIGSLGAGTHILRIVADTLNTISESNEGDNEYTKTITVSPSANSPTISNVTFQSAKITIITGAGFGSSPRVFVNDVDRSDFISSASDTSIMLKKKRKKLGLKTGDNLVRVVGTGGISSSSFLVRILADGSLAPKAPGNLTAVGVSTTEIDLRWQDNSNNEDGFKVERKTGSGGTYSEIASLAANTIMYQDQGLSAGATYFYRVRAFVSAGTSDYSGEASAMITSATPKFLLYVNRTDPRLLRVEKPNGDIVEYQGQKNASGLATSLKYVLITTAAGNSSTISIDNMGRPTEIRASNGVVFKLVWLTSKLVLISAITPTGEIEVTFSVDLTRHSMPPVQQLRVIRRSESAQESNAGANRGDNQSSAFQPSATDPVFTTTACNLPSYSLITVKRCNKPVNDASVAMAIMDGNTNLGDRKGVSTGVDGEYRVDMPMTDPHSNENKDGKCAAIIGLLEPTCEFLGAISPFNDEICSVLSGAISIIGSPVAGGILLETCPVILPLLDLGCLALPSQDMCNEANAVDSTTGPVFQMAPVIEIDGSRFVGSFVTAPQNGPFPCFEIQLPGSTRVESFTFDPAHPVRGQAYTATAKVLCGSPFPNNPLLLSMEGNDGSKASVSCGIDGNFNGCRLVVPAGRSSTRDTFTVSISGFSISVSRITITLDEPVGTLKVRPDRRRSIPAGR